MNEREILESTYYDTSDVYRIEELEDEDGVTKQERTLIYQDIKCSFSKRSNNVITVTDSYNDIKSSHTLFLSDEYEIKTSDIIYIKNKNIYLRAGEVFIYQNSHSEVTVEIVNKA